MEPRNPEDIRRDVLEAWNPKGVGSTLGTDSDRLILLPRENRLVVVQVNRLAAAILLGDWRAVELLMDGLTRTGADLCVLRANVLAEELLRPGLHRAQPRQHWRDTVLELGAATAAALPATSTVFDEGFRDGLDHFLGTRAEGRSILEEVSIFLSPLSVESCLGAALAGGVLLSASLLVSGSRSARELAREQVALVSAFMAGEVISHADNHVRNFR